MRFVFAFVVVASAACSAARKPSATEPTPGLVFPAEFAEGKNQGAGVEETPAPATSAVRSTAPPDPEPLRQAEQYELHFSHRDGVVELVSTRALRYPKPIVTARRVGRFSVELWVGQELVERARFDFPFLAAEEPQKGRRKPLHQPPSLAGGVLRASVLIPAAVRARRAVLVDRATGQETPLEWPPKLNSAATTP